MTQHMVFAIDSTRHSIIFIKIVSSYDTFLYMIENGINNLIGIA